MENKIIKYTVVKKILDDNNSLINRDDEIPFDVVELLRNNKVKANPLFTKYSKEESGYHKPVKYKVHVKCDKCNVDIINEMSKSRILSNVKVICYDCQNQINKDKKNDNIVFEMRMKMKRLTETSNYLKLLDPNEVWNKTMSNKERWSFIDNYYVENDIISNTLRKLSYLEFLKTPYWKAVVQKVMYKDKYGCQLCGKSKVILNVHHKTYEHHGLEHKHLEDLICLCHGCHQKFHEKLIN